jgi:hypothetical protein
VETLVKKIAYKCKVWALIGVAGFALILLSVFLQLGRKGQNPGWVEDENQPIAMNISKTTKGFSVQKKLQKETHSTGGKPAQTLIVQSPANGSWNFVELQHSSVGKLSGGDGLRVDSSLTTKGWLLELDGKNFFLPQLTKASVEVSGRDPLLDWSQGEPVVGRAPQSANVAFLFELPSVFAAKGLQVKGPLPSSSPLFFSLWQDSLMAAAFQLPKGKGPFGMSFDQKDNGNGVLEITESSEADLALSVSAILAANVSSLASLRQFQVTKKMANSDTLQCVLVFEASMAHLLMADCTRSSQTSVSQGLEAFNLWKGKLHSLAQGVLPVEEQESFRKVLASLSGAEAKNFSAASSLRLQAAKATLGNDDLKTLREKWPSQAADPDSLTPQEKTEIYLKWKSLLALDASAAASLQTLLLEASEGSFELETLAGALASSGQEAAQKVLREIHEKSASDPEKYHQLTLLIGMSENPSEETLRYLDARAQEEKNKGQKGQNAAGLALSIAIDKSRNTHPQLYETLVLAQIRSLQQARSIEEILTSLAHGGNVGDARFLAVASRFASHAHARVRAQVLMALRKGDWKTWRSVYEKALGDEEDSVRLRAVSVVKEKEPQMLDKLKSPGF